MLDLYTHGQAVPRAQPAAPERRCAGRPPCGLPPTCLSLPPASVSAAHIIAFIMHMMMMRRLGPPADACLDHIHCAPAAPYLTAAEVKQDQWQTKARPAVPVHIPDHSSCNGTCQSCSQLHLKCPLVLASETISTLYACCSSAGTITLDALHDCTAPEVLRDLRRYPRHAIADAISADTGGDVIMLLT
jgi:hypothetical protein